MTMALRTLAAYVVLCTMLAVSTLPAPAHADEATVTIQAPPPQGSEPAVSSEPCPKGKRGGAIGGIVVGSVFWWLLPMSIPLWVTQSKKLKAHNKARLERRCQYAPGS